MRALVSLLVLGSLAACLDFEKAHQLCITQGRCAPAGVDGGGGGGTGGGTLGPVFQQHPASVTVVAGREASFSATATGSDPLTWEWLADSVLLADGPGTGKLAGAIITGAGTTTLRVWIVPLKADGVVFKARVRNPAGSQLSDPATLRLSTAGRVELVAGKLGGPGAADGVGEDARFHEPGGLAVDSAGNLYVADTQNHTVRRVTPQGQVTTVAGRAAYSGYENRPAADARFFEPFAVTRDDAGNLYVADSANNCIRMISTAGVVTTLAGTTDPGAVDGMGGLARFNFPTALTWASPNTLYVADTDNHSIRVIDLATAAPHAVSTRAGVSGSPGSTDGSLTSARFQRPTGLALDATGNLWVADSGNSTIRKISAQGMVTTVAGLAGASGNTNGTGSAARFGELRGLTVDRAAGNVFVLDRGAVRQVTPAGVVTTLAGVADQWGSVDGTGVQARFGEPVGIVMGPDGVLTVADTGNGTLRRVTRAGVVTTLAGTPPASGQVDGTGGEARFMRPAGIALDSSGGAWIADPVACTIRWVSPLGDVTTIAGAAEECVYADGPATSARFNQPVGIAVTDLGVVYVADTGNGLIRRIDPSTRVVSTFAGVQGGFASADGPRLSARFLAPVGLALKGETELFVSDAVGNTIRHITLAGDVTTLAGAPMMSGHEDGVGADARFSMPLALAYANTGSYGGTVFVADTDNNVVRAILVTPRLVTTYAGSGNQGAFDGPTGAATFAGPCGIAVTPENDVLVTEQWNHTVRRIRSGTVSTVLGTPGVGRVVLGSSPGGLNAPFGIAVRSGVMLLTSPLEPALLRGVP